MFTRHLFFCFLLTILIKGSYSDNNLHNQNDGYVSSYSSYVSKTASNREELEKASELENELSKLRSLSKGCGGGRLNSQTSGKLLDGKNSIACTNKEYKLDENQVKELGLNLDNNIPKLNSDSIDKNQYKNSLSYSSSVSSKTISTPILSTKTIEEELNSKPILDKYSTGYYSNSYSNNKDSLNPSATLSKINYQSNYKDYDLDRSYNSGKLASKLTSQINKANSQLETSSKLLSQIHSSESTIGHSLHESKTNIGVGSFDHSGNKYYGSSRYSSNRYGSGLNGYESTKGSLTDHRHLHVDKSEITKTYEPAYTKDINTKGGRIVETTHIDKTSTKGGSVKGHHGTSVLVTNEEEERIEREREKNVVQLDSSDKLNSKIFTNKTQTYLFCESGEMLVKINFTNNFRGVVYANDRSSSCRIYGDGRRNYELRIPLNGCGTKKEEIRLFVNNITVRFHQTLELEEDEIKTIICRYPPPSAPIPIPVIPPIKPTQSAPIIGQNKLSEIELILVICFLLFLPILLLGIGISYYGLKRRNIKVIRKRRLMSGAPSEITKISHSTFEPVRIPRVAVSDYNSESETKTILSDSSSLRRDQYHTQKLKHIPELKVQHLDTTYLANQRFVEEETENILQKKTTTNYFKKVPPLPPASIPDNDNWSHSEFTDIVDRKEYVAQKPKYSLKTEKQHFINLEEDMSIEEKLIKNKNLASLPTPKYQVKNINDTFVTNIKETATSCEKLLDYVIDNQTQQNKNSNLSNRFSDQKKYSTSSSYKYEDTFMFERKFNVLKNLFNQNLPKSVSYPKVGFTTLTSLEKNTWSTLISNDETFKNLIVESSTYDDYIRVSRDLRYEHYFTPRTWETIINTLSNKEIISRWDSSIYDEQKYNEQAEFHMSNNDTQKLIGNFNNRQNQRSGGHETISYSKQINKLVDGAREKLMEQQFESSQRVYRQGGTSGLLSASRSTNVLPEQQALLDKSGSRRSSIHNQESRSITEEDINFTKPKSYKIDGYLSDDQRKFNNQGGYKSQRLEYTIQNSGYNTLGKLSTTTDEREEIKSITETHVDDQWYKKTLRK